MQTSLTIKQLELVEKFGVFMEHEGVSPAQARILGLLMICDEAELTFEDIYNTLQISKSAASNALNSLLLIQRIQYHTKPGDRKRYFFVNPARFEDEFDKILVRLSQSSELYKELLQGRSRNNPKYNADLKRLIEFMAFMEKELRDVFKKWRKGK